MAKTAPLLGLRRLKPGLNGLKKPGVHSITVAGRQLSVQQRFVERGSAAGMRLAGLELTLPIKLLVLHLIIRAETTA